MSLRSSDDLTPISRTAALYKTLFETAVTLAELRMPDEQQSSLQRRHPGREALPGLGDRWQQPAAVQRAQR